MIRTAFLGLAAILAGLAVQATGAMAAPPAKISPAEREKGMAAAPALIAASNTPCTLADARYIGAGQFPYEGKPVDSEFTEVACTGDLGYILIGRKNGTADSLDCLEVRGSDGKGSIKCSLPGNTPDYTGLQGRLKTAGSPCIPTQAQYLGGNTVGKFYEVVCQSGDGLTVTLLTPRTATSAIAIQPCLARVDSPKPCVLTTRAQSVAAANALAAKATPSCAGAPAGQRFIAANNENIAYIEIACADKTGFVLKLSPADQILATIPCSQAGGIAGGCTLSAATQASTADTGLYTSLAKKAGFDCTVDKYGLFARKANDPAGFEAVELSCANRPDGGIGLFGDANYVVNCVQAQAEGYRCSYTADALAYPSLTQALKSKGRGTCTVSAARPMAISESESFVEVGCSDGLPGFIIGYNRGTPVVKELLNCTQGASMNLSCKIPTNKS